MGPRRAIRALLAGKAMRPNPPPRGGGCAREQARPSRSWSRYTCPKSRRPAVGRAAIGSSEPIRLPRTIQEQCQARTSVETCGVPPRLRLRFRHEGETALRMGQHRVRVHPSRPAPKVGGHLRMNASKIAAAPVVLPSSRGWITIPKPALAGLRFHPMASTAPPAPTPFAHPPAGAEHPYRRPASTPRRVCGLRRAPRRVRRDGLPRARG